MDRPTPPPEVQVGQVWCDRQGPATVISVGRGYATLQRHGRNPFVTSVDQLLEGKRGWGYVRSPTP